MALFAKICADTIFICARSQKSTKKFFLQQNNASRIAVLISDKIDKYELTHRLPIMKNLNL